ncbi:MAG TPA: alpha/beta fold hydrolase [Bryobacteraceae bacterium]|nr:alpha/beta fold hydrolase [Bryobacteraceae bacterium]
MNAEFKPIVRNPHLLTIAANYWPRKIDHRRFPGLRREYRIDPLATILALAHQPDSNARGQIVLLHGLEGCADSGYMQSFAQAALVRGFGVHRLNSRTCGGTEELCETMYHSGLTDDVLAVLEQLQRQGSGPAFIVGFSLGGNVALKLAGELGTTDLLAGICAVSTPIDLAACVRHIQKRSNMLYARRFVNRLCERVKRKSKSSPHLYSTAGLDQVKTIWEFDDRFTAPLFGFGTAANYYATQSAVGYLDRIRVPALVICAKDDPLIPFAVYSHPAFQSNPALTLVATEHGGHLGFLARGKDRFWVDGVALNWIESVLESAGRNRAMCTDSGCG